MQAVKGQEAGQWISQNPDLKTCRLNESEKIYILKNNHILPATVSK